MAVPYTFGTATAAIPLSQLDSNFATAITIGNTAVQLGNTVTTLNNMTLANVTISSGSVTVGNVSITIANVSTANVTTLVVTGNASFTSNSAVLLAKGTTAQQPAGVAGYIRFNTDTTQFEGYNGTAWTDVGGGATGGGSDQIFVQNQQTVTTDYTISTNYNAMSTGPITINSGITVTVPSGSNWVVL